MPTQTLPDVTIPQFSRFNIGFGETGPVEDRPPDVDPPVVSYDKITIAVRFRADEGAMEFISYGVESIEFTQTRYGVTQPFHIKMGLQAV